MSKELLVGLTRSTLHVAPTEMVTPHNRDTSLDENLLDLLNQMRVDFNKLLDERIRYYLDNTVPYRNGDVIDVDLSWVGKKRPHFKGAKRFLIRRVEPFFWSDQFSGRYKKLFVNLYGLYLAENGDLLLPETDRCGIPTMLNPCDVALERICLNTGGENSTVLGLSKDQNHHYQVLADAIEAQEAKERSQQNG